VTHYISASKLNSFFQCPAQYAYSRTYEPLTKDKFLEDGTAAHALLAGERPAKLTVRARAFYEQLQLLYKEGGYTPLWLDENDKPRVEMRQVVALGKKLKLVRVIDALANVDGEAVLIDYKTAVWPWRKLRDGKVPAGVNPVPQSMGFQATAYLIPPDEPTPFKWPTRIDFLVASERGGMSVHTYRSSKDDVANLIDAANMVTDATVFPKHRGSSCAFCQFKDACFGTAGWQKMYLEKGKDNAKSNK
jgi:CRISPR/Cas system-associated exonuclease Cas4 (RecB family)